MPLTWCLIVLQKILKPSNPSNIRLMSVWSPSTDSWECKNTMNPFHIHLTIRGRINSGANIRSTAIPLSSTECSRGFPFHLRLTFVQRIMVHLTCIRLTSWSGIWNGLYPFGYPQDIRWTDWSRHHLFATCSSTCLEATTIQPLQLLRQERERAIWRLTTYIYDLLSFCEGETPFYTFCLDLSRERV